MRPGSRAATGVSRSLVKAIAVMLVLTLASSSDRPAHALTSSQLSQITSDLSFNDALFVSTVPSYPVLGHNYTVKLQVTNISNESVPIVLRLDAPIEVVFTSPIYLNVEVGPSSQTTFNFTLVAYAVQRGPLNVTATMWVWYINQMNRPVIAQQISTSINGVNYSPQSREAELLLAVVAVLAVLGGGYALMKRRGWRP
jgi:hypothetical protein